MVLYLLPDNYIFAHIVIKIVAFGHNICFQLNLSVIIHYKRYEIYNWPRALCV
jgi:hypothetical protein